MTVVAFKKPSGGVSTPPKRKPGGDDSVERDGLGRPRIVVPCDNCGTTGKVPSEKVEGRLNKCPKCKGEGTRKESYTRVTTFIDALEDKSNLTVWKGRMVLLGVAMDSSILDDVLTFDPTTKEGRDALNRKAEVAAEKAGASKKADKGTELHEYTEIVDQGLPLPDEMDPDDWIDIQSYAFATQHLFEVDRMEELVVNDELKVAGTPDRIYKVREGVTLTAPDGQTFTGGDLTCGDTKTGSIEYSRLKFAMQLSIYVNSKLYNKETGERTSMGDVSTDWGIIMHTAAGAGRTDLYWLDLKLGWEAVKLAAAVRAMRSNASKALLPLSVA